MKAGRRSNVPSGKIDYKQLKKINPEAARRAVLGYLKTNNRNISQAACFFGINQAVIYDIIKKEQGVIYETGRIFHSFCYTAFERLRKRLV